MPLFKVVKQSKQISATKPPDNSKRKRNAKRVAKNSRSAMKIGPATALPRPPDGLPAELIDQIVSYTVSTVKGLDRQHSLWACCLISKRWYSATISRLYEKPILVNKNFDKFARTLCPPISSHQPRIGLEQFVKHLDMGRLAYESSKSQTARLLRRTGFALEAFVAPAVSFSITSHTPLSKSRNLKTLDLSRVYCDLNATQLLNISRNLDSLTDLNTPANIFHCKHIPSTSWPPNLEILRLNGKVSYECKFWRNFSRAWPDTLHTLICEDVNEFANLWDDPASFSSEIDVELPQIKTLRLGRACRSEIYGGRIGSFLTLFPEVQNLSITFHWLNHLLLRSAGFPRTFQRLELTPLAGEFRLPLVFFTDEIFTPHLDTFPMLWQVRVDRSLVLFAQTAVDGEDDGMPVGLRQTTEHLREKASQKGHDPRTSFIWEDEGGVLSFPD